MLEQNKFIRFKFFIYDIHVLTLIYLRCKYITAVDKIMTSQGKYYGIIRVIMIKNFTIWKQSH
jgi:hypothetical protein